MKLNHRVYRFFQYFSEGLSFLSLPLSILNFITVIYYLLIGNIAFLKWMFPSFLLFIVSSLVILIPLAIGIGWLRMKRSLFYGIQGVVMTESNPLTVHSSRVLYEMELAMLIKLKVKPSAEYMRLLEYWRSLDKEQNWRPQL